jgi:hypothetical protein
MSHIQCTNKQQEKQHGKGILEHGLSIYLDDLMFAQIWWSLNHITLTKLCVFYFVVCLFFGGLFWTTCTTIIKDKTCKTIRFQIQKS